MNEHEMRHNTDLYLNPKKVPCKEFGEGVYILTKKYCGLPKGFAFRNVSSLERDNA